MRALALAPLLLVTSSAGAFEIASYELRLQMTGEDRGHVLAAVKLERATPGPLDLPLGFPAVDGLTLTECPAGTTLAAKRHNGQMLAEIVLPAGAPESIALGFEFDVMQVFERLAPKRGKSGLPLPVGHRTFRHSLLNSQPATIDHYRFELAFPEGTRAHAIREALPGLRPDEPGPRAQLDLVGTRPGVWLAVDHLVQGETAAVKVEVMPKGRSPIWLVVGLVLSLLYLVNFRDLVARKR